MDASDDELVVMVKQTGNRDAFGELVRRHQASVRSTLVGLTKDPSLADDLAQDAFIRAYDRIDQYTLGRSFRSWLGGIAYNEYLQGLRRIRTSRRHLESLASDLADPGEFANEESAAIDLDRALENLRVEERTAVVLSYGFGMSHAEISSVMQAPVGTVKSWENRGKDKVRGRLEGYSSSCVNE